MAIGAVYGGRDFALWRWRQSPVDDVVIAFVRAATGLSPGELAALRDGLGIDDFYTLSFFARRWALRALRVGDPARVREAFDALAVIDVDRMDFRDFSPAFASVVARRMGLQPMAVVAGAIARATPAVAGKIAEHASNEAYAQDTAALVRLVDTEDGTVVVDGHGFSNLPASHDLIADVLAIADAVEDEGTYVVSAVSVASGLPAWFVRAAASSVEMAAVTRLSGCVHLVGTLAAPTRRHTANNELCI